jgi:hypothetical protein
VEHKYTRTLQEGGVWEDSYGKLVMFLHKIMKTVSHGTGYSIRGDVLVGVILEFLCRK